VYEIATERIPILVWGDDADESTLSQTRNLANLPFAFGHIALMPDAHVGFGMPIGGVLAAVGQVIPHAVGLDIGCGVRAWCTNVPAADVREVRDRLLSDMQRSIPTGFDWHKHSQADRTELFESAPDIPALQVELAKAARQVGTLGGGNHFLELQADEDGMCWAMIHSGSRNIGKQIAEHYDRLARETNRREGSEVPPQWGLAHLDIDAPAGREYLAAMEFCMSFAAENRRLMMQSMLRALKRVFPDAEPAESIDVHHNYAAIETHFGTEVVVHRKGAVRAEGTVIIPGSMGTVSYIARGLSNPDSFVSCSHGAGRRLGRKEAVRTIPVERVLDDLKARDIRLFKPKKGDVAEESPEAYKDIEDVMRHQRDLVEPVMRLTPFGVIKA
jgi:tRNA-splicing ligase RtcB